MVIPQFLEVPFITLKHKKPQDFRIPLKILTSKKCGRSLPMVYFPTSVSSWEQAAPKPNTPTDLYASTTQYGTVMLYTFSGCLSDFFTCARTNSVPIIWNVEKKGKGQRVWVERTICWIFSVLKTRHACDTVTEAVRGKRKFNDE